MLTHEGRDCEAERRSLSNEIVELRISRERNDRGDKPRQILNDHLPDDVLVDPKVVVDHLVAHADDVSPRDLGVRPCKLLRHLPCSLADDLNEMRQCEAEILVVVIREA